MYVLHHPSSGNNNIVETADGKWDWALDCTTPNPWNPSENASIWHQTDPNPVAGLNELERYKTFRSGACPATFDDYTGEEIGDDEDAFKIGYNELYSPWSNPRSRSTGIAVQLLSMIGGDATVRFFFSNPEDAPPAKPYRLVSSWSPADCDPVVDLSWTAGTEPDMTDAGDPGSYRVWRSMNGADFTPVAMVTHPTTTCSDDLATQAVGVGTLEYRISAVDNTDAESVRSESIPLGLIGAGTMPASTTSTEVGKYHSEWWLGSLFGYG